MNLDKSLAFYKDRFADASDFTFVFVGNFDLAAMKPLVEQYLGVAAGDCIGTRTGRTSACARTRRASIEKRVEKGIEPEEPDRDRLHRTVPVRPGHRVAIRAVALVLEGRLREALREELGGTYSVTTNDNSSKVPTSGVTNRRGVRLRSASGRTTSSNAYSRKSTP